MSVDHKQVAENFSRAAERYDALATHQNQWMRQGLNWAMHAFPQRGEVLDIGCGTGSFADEAKKLRPDWRIVGLDIAPGMLAIAAQRCAEVVEADAENLPFKHGRFDGVFSSLALQWPDDKQRAWNEIARVLKPGAAAVIVTLGEENLKELAATGKEVDIEMLPMVSATEYAAIAAKAGFTVTHMESPAVRIDYPSAREFLNSMRDIGAGNAQKEHDKQAARQKVGRLVELYETRYASNEGVYATWQPVFLSLKKA